MEKLGATTGGVVASGVGLIGQVAGNAIAGGVGVGKAVKKFVREIKYKRSIKSAKAEFKQSFKQSKTHTRYLFKPKTKFWSGTTKSGFVNIFYSSSKAGYNRRHR